MGAEATAFSCRRAVKNEETEAEEREGGRRRRRDEREREKDRERRRKDIARQAEEERVEEDDVGPDATRHRRVKSTLHRDITIVFVTAAGVTEREVRDTVTSRGCNALSSPASPPLPAS